MNYPNYNPYYPQYQQRQYPTMQTPQQSGMVWVNGEREAMDYPVAPNGAVAMWDCNASSVYLKQTDAAGRPSFKAYDLVERTGSPSAAPNVQMDNFITREEFDRLAAAVAALKGEKE